MNLRIYYIYGDEDPCKGDAAAPYPTQICNDIEEGILAAVQAQDDDDDFSIGVDGYLWAVLPEDGEYAQANELEAGNLVFVDDDNDVILFALSRWLVTKNRVRDVAKLCLSYEYQVLDGNPGYIVRDGSLEEDGTWYPLAALSPAQFRAAVGNPFFSILEMAANAIDGILDGLLPDVLNLVPWWGYVAGAGYTAVRAKEEKMVSQKSLFIGLTGYLGFRAYRSYEAKNDRK